MPAIFECWLRAVKFCRARLALGRRPGYLCEPERYRAPEKTAAPYMALNVLLRDDVRVRSLFVAHPPTHTFGAIFRWNRSAPGSYL